MKFYTLLILVLFICLCQIVSKSFALICYSCTSTLSPIIDDSAQLALRVFLNSFYSIPSTNSLCNNENDIEFKVKV